MPVHCSRSDWPGAPLSKQSEKRDQFHADFDAKAQAGCWSIASSSRDAHFANFSAAVRKGEPLHAPIAVGNVSVTMLQLSNIAWEVERELHLDVANGRIQKNAAAMKLWDRQYELSWAPRFKEHAEALPKPLSVPQRT